MVHDKPESYLIIGVIAVCTVQIGTMMTLFIPRLVRVMSKTVKEFENNNATRIRLSTMVSADNAKSPLNDDATPPVTNHSNAAFMTSTSNVAANRYLMHQDTVASPPRSSLPGSVPGSVPVSRIV